MQPGFLSARGALLLWTPGSRKRSELPVENDLLIQGMSFPGKKNVHAYICKDFQTVIAQYYES